jgi:nucleotide-binding universal stress UspA family protein
LVSSHGRLTLAYVKVIMLKPEPDSGAVSLAAERRHAMKRLASLRDESHVDARVLSIEAHSAAKGLHEFAEGLDAELLVIGACRRDDYERTFVGDDTRAILENAPCPVAIAPLAYASRASALRKIGAAYDGSPESEGALALARKLAREHSAELSAFEAVREPLYVPDVWNPQREIDKGVAKARERIARLGGVEAHAASGDAAEELGRYGASVELLVVGSHKYRPIDHLLSGTTA